VQEVAPVRDIFSKRSSLTIPKCHCLYGTWFFILHQLLRCCICIIK